MAITRVWEEAFRPKSLKDVVFSNQAIRAYFTELVASGDPIPNMLFVGHHGTGKTTLSKVLPLELGIDKSDILTIPCSSRKMEAIRNEVEPFAYGMPTGKYRIVRLEEMDMLSLEAQGLLRTLIEEVNSNCRFIGTANYEKKIIPPILSRLAITRFSAPQVEEVLVRCADILTQQNIAFEIEDLERIVTAGYPDIRKVIQTLERNCRTGKLLSAAECDKTEDWKLSLLPLIEQGNFGGARDLVGKFASTEDLPEIYTFLAANIDRVATYTRQQKDAGIVILAKYQYQHNFVSSPELQIAALLVELAYNGRT